ESTLVGRGGLCVGVESLLKAVEVVLAADGTVEVVKGATRRSRQPLDAKASATSGPPTQGVLGVLPAGQTPPRPNLAGREYGQRTDEPGGILALLGQADKPQPAQADQLADGVLLSVLTLDIAEDDLPVPFESWQDLKEAGLQLGYGEGRHSILHGGDLLDRPTGAVRYGPPRRRAGDG